MLGMTTKQSFHAEVNQSSDDKIKLLEFPIKNYWSFSKVIGCF